MYALYERKRWWSTKLMLCGVVRITGESLDMLMVPAKPLAPCPFRRAPLLQAKNQKPKTEHMSKNYYMQSYVLSNMSRSFEF
jgi:hypothetical protein